MTLTINHFENILFVEGGTKQERNDYMALVERCQFKQIKRIKAKTLLEIDFVKRKPIFRNSTLMIVVEDVEDLINIPKFEPDHKALDFQKNMERIAAEDSTVIFVFVGQRLDLAIPYLYELLIEKSNYYQKSSKVEDRKSIHMEEMDLFQGNKVWKPTITEDKKNNEKTGFLVSVMKPFLVLSDENGKYTTLMLEGEKEEFWASMEDCCDRGLYLTYDPIKQLLTNGGEWRG